MRLLLDTHVYLWCITNDRRLSQKAQSLILNAAETYVSSISICEIAIKIKLGKLNGDVNELVDAINRSGFLELSLTVKHAAELYQLSDIHRDPFDRILIAQAISEPLRFLTADSILIAYSELVELV